MSTLIPKAASVKPVAQQIPPTSETPPPKIVSLSAQKVITRTLTAVFVRLIALLVASITILPVFVWWIALSPTMGILMILSKFASSSVFLVPLLKACFVNQGAPCPWLLIPLPIGAWRNA